jgi:glycosyltransferase involved in cell wall biosynthesis
MTRIDIINALIKKHNYKTYVEIGVRNPDDCFNHINCETKHGVDPGVEGSWKVTFNMTSDEFFNSNPQKYDIIFIDGLHIDDQVERDIINSLNYLNENGSIILHDCNPPTIHHARENYYDVSTPASGDWNGTVWKAIVKVRSELDNIYTSVVDTDWGVGIIQKSNKGNKIINDNPYYTYEKFSSNRKHYLNLITPDEFLEQYIGVELQPTSSKPNITWLAKYDDYSSMGILSQRILEQLDKRDYNLACKAIIGTTETENPLIYDLLSKTPKKDIGIMFSYPDMAEYLNEFKTKVIYTGVDTTDEAGNFVENANKVDYLFTPSKLSKKRIENMGVKKPVFVLPHGIDPEVFKYTERTKTDIFKFLYVGECSDRKGIFHLLKAFTDLFKNNPKVELHIKSNTDMLFYNSKEVQDIIKDYKNIFWHIGNVGHDEVIKLYKECHAYVYPSRGDSFGMTLLEAMACGLPIITTKLPGATDVVDGKVTYIKSKIIPVQGHPWFKGEWGEPDLEDLKSKMKSLYENYDTSKLKEYSDFIRENYSWEKIVDKFEQEILPKLGKKTKVLTLLTSYNRPHHIKNIIQSLKEIEEQDIINDIYIVENSDPEYKEECLNIINKNTNGRFILYNSKFNLGQRGSLLQMLDYINIDEYDYIQFTDQDNIFVEPISTYCNLLDYYPKYFVSTGYMSKEHTEMNWINNQWGNLCEKRTCRAGHMMFRSNDIKSLLPIYLDSQHNEPRVNSSWNAGLDWELTYWNPKSPGFLTPDNFIICVPGGVIHKGIDSTIYEWPVEENEYTLEELKKLRNKIN